MSVTDPTTTTTATTAMPRRRFRLARRAARACLVPLLRQAARAYVAGETLDDALRVVRHLVLRRRLPAIVGYFNEDTDPPRQVADECLRAVAAMRAEGNANHTLAIKLPALGHSQALLEELLAAASQGSQAQVSIHLDAMWPDSAAPTRQLVDRLLDRDATRAIGFTLPGRWRRSVEDAEWVIARRLPTVRVVKGQWEDPADPACDLYAGFLRVVDRLAGRAPHVAVATHDLPLAQESIRRLRRAGTSCRIELLYGLPMRRQLWLAQELGAPVRVYVPYGKAHLPYVVSKAMAQPHLIAWLVKDLLARPVDWVRYGLTPTPCGARA